MERRKASPEQLNMLLQMLEGDKELAIGKFSGLEGKIHQTNAWIKITEKLNANSGFGSGAIKTPDKWQQTWRDWKSNVKKKAFKIRKSRFTPGGNNIHLTESEEKILRLICGNTSVFGLSGVPETSAIGNNTNNLNTNTSNHEQNGDEMIQDPTTSNLQVFPQGSVEITMGEEEVMEQANNTTQNSNERPAWRKNVTYKPARVIHDKLLTLEEERIRIEKQKLLEKKRCNNIRIKMEKDRLELERQRNVILERLLMAVENMRKPMQ